MSQGTVDNILCDMQKKSQSESEEIRSRIEQSTVVGGDETGVNINGELQWIWAWQTDGITYAYNDK